MKLLKTTIILFILALFVQGTAKDLYPFQEIISRASQKYGIDSFLIAAVIKTESNFHKNSRGSGDCNGLMQIKKGPFEPVKNIMCGTGIFKHYLKKCNGDIQKALGSYNRGFAGYKKYLRKHGHHSKYVQKIIKQYEKYKEQNMSLIEELKILKNNINYSSWASVDIENDNSIFLVSHYSGNYDSLMPVQREVNNHTWLIENGYINEKIVDCRFRKVDRYDKIIYHYRKYVELDDRDREFVRELRENPYCMFKVYQKYEID